MRLNWKDHGRRIHGNYILRWWTHDLYTHYEIFSYNSTLYEAMFDTGKPPKIILDKIIINDISNYVSKLP